jgi:fused signal recognition particle receptor
MTDKLSRWRAGLSKTSKYAFGRLARVLGATEITGETWDELEAILIQADLGVDIAIDVIENIKQVVKNDGLLKSEQLWEALRVELRSRLVIPPLIQWTEKPSVLMVVGVNGSGKTTSIAKLGKRFVDEGLRVIFGAADTFRAAAIDQLQEWGSRIGVDVVTGAPDSDPGAVAYNTVQAGIARASDLVIIDTAGRMHTRFNLMEELKKVYRVTGKALPGAPHQVWLVLDSTTGQNALHQARAFKDAVNVTGVILAKLDSSARGGMAFAIKQELGLPILFAGLGESADDLQPFDPDAFVEGIISAK